MPPSNSFPPMPPNMQGLSLSWFRESDWPRWLEIDPEFQPDYQHWLRRSEAAYEQYKAAGVPIIKVVIDPEEFLAWSKATGSGIGTSASARYTVMPGMARDKESDRDA